MPKQSIPYIPLAQDTKTTVSDRSPSTWRKGAFVAAFAASLLLNVYFLVVWELHKGPRNPLSPQISYSPAQDVLEYNTVAFSSGFGNDIPIWDRPPSEEVDDAWKELYKYAYNSIPRSQAALLTNRTYPILGEKGEYMVALDVFHQLHCLDEVRKAMYPEIYPHTSEGMHTDHMRHCLSSLRQSLMCSADVSTIVWQWSENAQAAKERSDIIHTCRNFEKIRGWAKEHYLPVQQNMSVYIPDDLTIPSS